MVDLDRGIGSPLGGSATATAANGIGTGMKATTIGQVCHKREGGGDARKEGAAAREREEAVERRNVECPTSHHPSLSECVKLYGSDLRRAPPLLHRNLCETVCVVPEWGVLLRKP